MNKFQPKHQRVNSDGDFSEIFTYSNSSFHKVDYDNLGQIMGSPEPEKLDLPFIEKKTQKLQSVN